ncbi:hypothetical protein [Candidatus Uabimicrobium amorphum]|uniref:Uncharacterized protein n=1 Tax=Uabimicrobium amorphum TaxID=2596890 RepID=A0A5S9F5N7_UABAM|nr:hypothetical protein [Candidatus Uabimicrobium amorphum]BBM86313.1 hypothetical protein UABAM_04699 [Candidatus Uabimicrobium amorphum]
MNSQTMITSLAQQCIDHYLTPEQVDFVLQKVDVNPLEIKKSAETRVYYTHIIRYLAPRKKLDEWLIGLEEEGFVFTKDWIGKIRGDDIPMHDTEQKPKKDPALAEAEEGLRILQMLKKKKGK